MPVGEHVSPFGHVCDKQCLEPRAEIAAFVATDNLNAMFDTGARNSLLESVRCANR